MTEQSNAMNRGKATDVNSGTVYENRIKNLKTPWVFKHVKITEGFVTEKNTLNHEATNQHRQGSRISSLCNLNSS